jgi:hypothetical protein
VSRHNNGGTVPHWVAWHAAYDDPDSSLSRRLRVVREQLCEALDEAPVGPMLLLSLCAGDGRDVLGVLKDHPRRHDVAATLVELDPSLAERSRATSRSLGLDGVDVVTADAGRTSTYSRAAPYDVVVCCGVFGNLSDHDVRAAVRGLSILVKPGGSALWTRHRLAPDLTPEIRSWFAADGFEEMAFVQVEGSQAAVGRHRNGSADLGRRLEVQLFEFVGDGSGAHR